MRAVIRAAVGGLIALHGLIHFMGAAKGLGIATVSQLREPISRTGGVMWAVSGSMIVAAGVLALAQRAMSWKVAIVGALISQALIVASWSDARFGTLGNALLLLVGLLGFLANGPTSFRSQYADDSKAAIRDLNATALPRLDESDLDHLPKPVADYVRFSGSVGKPRIVGFSANISGRIRSKSDSSWMTFSGKQTNAFGASPARYFYMDATKAGLPVDVLHRYAGSKATMKVKLLSVLSMVEEAGPEMTQSETVTVLNDLCIMAPGAIPFLPVQWTPLDAFHARAVFSNAGVTVSAILTFDEEHRLVDFESNDRYRSTETGEAFELIRWSTPVRAYEKKDGWTFGVKAEGRWHPMGHSYSYLDFNVDDWTPNTAPVDDRPSEDTSATKEADSSVAIGQR
jgi:hypothetical protein